MRSSRISLCLAFGAGLVTCLLVAGADDPPRAKTLRELQKERVRVITERLELAQKAAKAGAGLKDEITFWEFRLALAKAELDGKPDELRKLYERVLESVRAAEAAAERQHKLGAGSVAEILEAREARLDIEIALAKLKRD